MHTRCLLLWTGPAQACRHLPCTFRVHADGVKWCNHRGGRGWLTSDIQPSLQGASAGALVGPCWPPGWPGCCWLDAMGRPSMVATQRLRSALPLWAWTRSLALKSLCMPPVQV